MIYATIHITERSLHVCVCVCEFKGALFFLFYRLSEYKKKDLCSKNVLMEPNHLALTYENNSAYGVATDGDPDHLYDTIPDAPREYEVPSKLQTPIQPPTYNDESRQKVQDVKGSNDGRDVNDVQGNDRDSDGDSDYYVNDP